MQNHARIILLSALTSLVVSIGVFLVLSRLSRPETVNVRPQRSFTDYILSGRLGRLESASPPSDFTKAALIVTPAVVNIKTLIRNGYKFWQEEPASLGSGVIISPDGYIVTNNHVIDEGEEIRITLNNRLEYAAKLVGKDPSTDIALVKIEAGNGLPYALFSDSDSIQVGEWVLAVGNPFDLQSTVTAGIISARGRSIDILDEEYRVESFIQTDAAVNPGNSGGALVNTKGLLVGINTAIMSRSGRYEGYSFAIPSNLVQKVVKDLKEFGVVQRGILGVAIAEVDNEAAKELKLPNPEGVLINRINPGSSAEDAGLQRGDVILSINGITVSSVPQLQELVARYRPGDVLKLDIFRNAAVIHKSLTLKNRVNTTATYSAKDDTFLESFGFQLRDMTPEEIREAKGRQGVLVVSILKNSRIERTNMDPGFIITKINGREIKQLDQLVREMKQANENIFLEGFYPDYKGTYYYAFPVN